jgi:hypothetical protein
MANKPPKKVEKKVAIEKITGCIDIFLLSNVSEYTLNASIYMLKDIVCQQSSREAA